MNLIDRIIHGKWVVRRTIWPYKDGYGTYRPRDRTLCDSGLSKAEAQSRCDELNRYGRNDASKTQATS